MLPENVLTLMVQYIGKENEENTLVLDMKTSGEKFYESGSGEDADYANPKALTAEGDLYVYGGDINVYTASKTTFKIIPALSSLPYVTSLAFLVQSAIKSPTIMPTIASINQ